MSAATFFMTAIVVTMTVISAPTRKSRRSRQPTINAVIVIMKKKLMRIHNTAQAVQPKCRPTFVYFANISPALKIIPTTAKNAGSAELTKISLSTVTYAIFAWTRGLREIINAGPTQGMIRAPFVLRMLFRAVRSYLAPIKYTRHVYRPCSKMAS